MSETETPTPMTDRLIIRRSTMGEDRAKLIDHARTLERENADLRERLATAELAYTNAIETSRDLRRQLAEALKKADDADTDKLRAIGLYESCAAERKALQDALAAANERADASTAALSIAQDALAECIKYPEMPDTVITQVNEAHGIVTKALDGEYVDEAAGLRERVIEECARACEVLSAELTYQRDSQGACDRCADAIRALAHPKGADHE